MRDIKGTYLNGAGLDESIGTITSSRVMLLGSQVSFGIKIVVGKNFDEALKS